MADFRTRQACRAGEGVNRPYHGNGPSIEKTMECCASRRVEVSPGRKVQREEARNVAVGVVSRVMKRVGKVVDLHLPDEFGSSLYLGDKANARKSAAVARDRLEIWGSTRDGGSIQSEPQMLRYSRGFD